MKKNRFYLLLALAIVASSVLAAFLALAFQEWRLLELETIPVEVIVTDTAMIGFNTDTDKMYFGTVVDGGHSKRHATLVTRDDAIVRIKVIGEVDGWVEVSENDFVLPAEEERQLHFVLAPPLGTPPGNYTGTVVMEYLRPLWR